MRWAALLAAGGVALAGCSGGDRTSSDHAPQTQSTTAASEQSAGGSAEPGSARQDSDDSSTDSSGSQAPTDAKVARTVNLSITVDDIDKAMVIGCAHPMGPLKLADLVGLDTIKAIADRMYEEFKEPLYAPPPLLLRMVEAGRLGKKADDGFYRYA